MFNSKPLATPKANLKPNIKSKPSKHQHATNPKQRKPSTSHQPKNNNISKTPSQTSQTNLTQNNQYNSTKIQHPNKPLAY